MSEQSVANDHSTPDEDDLLYEAWTVIANGAGWWGNTDADRQWRMAAERWRDRWHETLDIASTSPGDSA